MIAKDRTTPEPRRRIVRNLFNHTSQHYDKVNWLFSLGSGAWYRRSCLRRAGLRPGAKVVDIAAGTGLLAREAARREAWRVLRPGGTIVLLEINPSRRWFWRALAAGYIGAIMPLLAWLTTLDRRARGLMLYTVSLGDDCHSCGAGNGHESQESCCYFRN